MVNRNKNLLRATPTVAEIDLQALRFNFNQLKKRLPATAQSLCVVKSNAYGHGAVRVARTLEAAGADFFGVGTLDEGVELRGGGIRRPILILLGLVGKDEMASLVRHRLTPVLSDLPTAKRLHLFLSARKKSLEVHVKMDTGMSRLGVLPRNLGNFCDRLKGLSALKPVGLLTHLADAGEADFTDRQIGLFRTGVKEFRERFPGARFFHVANSQAAIDGRIGAIASGGRSPSGGSGATTGKQMGGSGVTPPIIGGDGPVVVDQRGRVERLSPPAWMVRWGIALYGAYPLERDQDLVRLKPVLRWKSRIVLLKHLPWGSPVSYGRTFYTKRETLIGVLPVGYADGYPRILSNRSHVLVQGRRVPVVGTICMDMMMVDLTGVPSARVGDEAVLIGRQRGQEEIRAEELAMKAETISYEIFCGIAERIPRIYR